MGRAAPAARLDRQARRELAAFLVDAAKDRPPNALSRIAATALPGAAVHHGVVFAARESTPLAKLPTEAASELERAYIEALAQTTQATAALNKIATTLSESDIRFAVLKGPASARWHPRPERRAFKDLDILVTRAQLSDAVEALTRLGGHEHPGTGREVLAAGAGEVDVVLASGVHVDLHWSLVNEPRLRRHLDLDTESLLARARDADVPGGRIPVLCDEDGLVHTLLHSAMNGGGRIGQLLDIHLMTQGAQVNWQDLGERLRGTAAGAVVSIMLMRATRIFGGRYPETMRDLASPLWLRAIGAADRLAPPEEEYGRRLKGGALLYVTRESSAQTLTSVVAFMLRRGLGRD